jgi:hypothetical protein
MRVTVGRDESTFENFNPLRRGVTFRAWGSDRERVGLFFELGLTLTHQAAATNVKHRRPATHNFDCIDGRANATAEPFCCSRVGGRGGGRFNSAAIDA